jgi:hypothetical protein
MTIFQPDQIHRSFLIVAYAYAVEAFTVTDCLKVLTRTKLALSDSYSVACTRAVNPFSSGGVGSSERPVTRGREGHQCNHRYSLQGKIICVYARRRPNQ